MLCSALSALIREVRRTSWAAACAPLSAESSASAGVSLKKRMNLLQSGCTCGECSKVFVQFNFRDAAWLGSVDAAYLLKCESGLLHIYCCTPNYSLSLHLRAICDAAHCHTPSCRASRSAQAASHGAWGRHNSCWRLTTARKNSVKCSMQRIARIVRGMASKNADTRCALNLFESDT